MDDILVVKYVDPWVWIHSLRVVTLYSQHIGINSQNTKTVALLLTSARVDGRNLKPNFLFFSPAF